MIFNVLCRDHIDSRYQAILAIEAHEGTYRKGLGLDEDDPQARKELWEVHEVADPLIPLLFGNLPLIRKRTNYVALSIRMAPSANGCFGCRDLIIG